MAPTGRLGLLLLCSLMITACGPDRSQPPVCELVLDREDLSRSVVCDERLSDYRLRAAPPPICTTRQSCADFAATCGHLADGCGGIQSCGSCPGGFVCNRRQGRTACDLVRTSTLDHPGIAILKVDDSGDCKGIVPAAPADHVAALLPEASGQGCGVLTSDGKGTVVLGQMKHPDAIHPARLLFFWPNGAGWAAELTDSVDLVPQASGFHVLGGGGVEALGTDGRRRAWHKLSGVGWRLAAAKGGGSVSLVTASAAGAPTKWKLEVLNADGRLAVEPREAMGSWDAQQGVQAPPVVSANGEVLVLRRNARAEIFGAWVRGDGRASSAERRFTELEDGVWPPRMTPLHDGTIAVKGTEGWSMELRSLSFHGDWSRLPPPPEAARSWLGADASADIFLRTWNRGYALIGQTASSPCAPAVELRSLSGRLCGVLRIAEHEGACGTVRVGVDGSLLQSIPSPAGCFHRWWPGLLK